MRSFEDENIEISEEDGIFYVLIKQKNLDLKIAKEIVEKRFAFTGQVEALLYIDNSKINSMNKEAREYFGSDESNQKVKAIAIFTKSKLGVFLANFVIKVNLTNYTAPIKLFTNKNKAIIWLKSITTILMILYKIY